MATKRDDLFENYPIPKAVAALSVPTVLSSLVMVLYNMADTYFVGLLNNPVETGAVTLAAPVLLAFNAVNNLFGVGSSSLMSRALGKKDYETVHRTSAFGFYGALCFSVLFSVLAFFFMPQLLSLLGADEITSGPTQDYLRWTTVLGASPAILNVVFAHLIRSEGSSLHASIGTMSGCLLNIILDPVFILGFGMASEGAGLATFISNCFALCYFFAYLIVRRGKTEVSISPKDFKPSKAVVVGVTGVGVPASIQNLLNVTSQTLMNSLAAGYGAAALAAMGICTKIHNIPLYITMGIGQGIMPLVSYNYASGNHKRMKDTMKFSLMIMEALMILFSIVLLSASGFLVGMFIENAETVSYGARFMKGISLGLPFLAFDFFCVGVFQAVGKGRNALIMAVVRKLVLEINLLRILEHFFKVYGIPYAQAVAEMFMVVISGIMLVLLLKDLRKQKTAPENSQVNP